MTLEKNKYYLVKIISNRDKTLIGMKMVAKYTGSSMQAVRTNKILFFSLSEVTVLHKVEKPVRGSNSQSSEQTELAL